MRRHAFAAATGFAAAMLLASGGQSHAAPADPSGYWMKPDAERESKIHVFKCGKSKKQLCAKIAWLKDPKDSRGRPLHDVRNESPSLRDRPIVGLAIFSGLNPSAPSTWTGTIYNPEDGKTYTATLTVLSRSKILLKGCKAWLLCGERQWLRTSPPPAETPAVPAEGTEQIEASATPSAPAAPQAVAASEPESAATELPELPARAPAPPDAMQASAEPQAPAEPQPAEIAATPAVLVTHTPPPAEYNSQQGYRFVSVPGEAASPVHLSGEDVSSMMVMSEPIASEAGAPPSGAPGETTATTQSGEPVPQQKPKAKAKPVLATAATKPTPTPTSTPKPATAAKPSTQAAPAPQETAAAPATAPADAETADASTATAEAAMVGEAPLTRRQKRQMRRQQHQQDPFLPWLR